MQLSGVSSGSAGVCTTEYSGSDTSSLKQPTWKEASEIVQLQYYRILEKFHHLNQHLAFNLLSSDFTHVG